MTLEELKNTANISKLTLIEDGIIHVKYIVLQDYNGVIHSETFEVSSSASIKTLLIEGKGVVTVIFLEINKKNSNKVFKITTKVPEEKESKLTQADVPEEAFKEPEVTEALENLKNVFQSVSGEGSQNDGNGNDPSLLFETFGRGMSKLFSMNNVPVESNQIKIENSLPSTLKVQIRKKT